MAGAIGWTGGALAQAEALGVLAVLPERIATDLPERSRRLGVHSSPGRDDGPGIDSASDDATLAGLVEGCGAQIVVGGHTHDPTDRVAGGVRALNPGSVGLPREPSHARWLLLEADKHKVDLQLRKVTFDVAAVVQDLHDRRYPNASYLEAVLTGQRSFGP